MNRFKQGLINLFTPYKQINHNGIYYCIPFMLWLKNKKLSIVEILKIAENEKVLGIMGVE